MVPGLFLDYHQAMPSQLVPALRVIEDDLWATSTVEEAFSVSVSCIQLYVVHLTSSFSTPKVSLYSSVSRRRLRRLDWVVRAGVEGN